MVYVPCSGLTGENLTGSSKEPLLRAWYNGPSLLDRIGTKSVLKERCYIFVTNNEHRNEYILRDV